MLSTAEQQATTQSSTTATPTYPNGRDRIQQKGIKVVFVGPNDGKTSMIVSYFENSFDFLGERTALHDGYIPTTADSRTFNIQIDGKAVVGVTEDTSSICTEEFIQMRPYAYQNAEVVVVVFAIDKKKSLQSAKDFWVPEVRQCLPNIPIILVGTQLDKRPEKDGGIGTRVGTRRQLISKAEIQQAGKSMGLDGCVIMECSSITKSGLHAVFETAIKAALAHRGSAAAADIQSILARIEYVAEPTLYSEGHLAAKMTTKRRCTIS